MRRWLGLVALLAVAAGIVVALGRGRSSSEVERSLGLQPWNVGRNRPPGPPDAPAGLAPTSPEAKAFVEKVANAQLTCDLPIAPACDAAGCVAFVEGPDLDQLGGWLRLAGARPRFVATVALRDLGVAPAWTPCGDAVSRLAPDGVLAIELPDGAEVWCVGDAARCDALGPSHVGTVDGAFQASTRRLSLDAGPR